VYQAEVVRRAKQQGPLLADDLRPRVSFLAGDMFEEIPGGRDVHVMKWILHDWHDDRAAAILANSALKRREFRARHGRPLVRRRCVSRDGSRTAGVVLGLRGLFASEYGWGCYRSAIPVW
jgi:O-methyltransferase domain